MTLAEIKRMVQPGQVYNVTNHYITRPEHPNYGTTRRTVTRVTGQRVYLEREGEGQREREVEWPKAAQVQADPDGTIRLYGGGGGQGPSDLFVTLAPVAAATGDEGCAAMAATAPGVSA